MRQLVLAATVLATLAGAQTFPVRLYGGSADERACALTEGVDSGFCLAGWTRSFGPGTPMAPNAAVVKTDPQGNPIWTSISIGGNDDEAHSMVKVADGYVVAGWTRSYGIGIPFKNIFVVKLDPNGAQLWGRVYGGMLDEEALSITPTMDGGFAVTGWTASFGPAPAPNVFVLRLNPAGLPMWCHVYWGLPMHVEDEGHSIVQTPDTGFAVCGRFKATGPTQWDPFLLKTDRNGIVQWVQTVPGDTVDDVAWSVDVDYMGRILVAGYTYGFGTTPVMASDFFVAAFQLAGVPVWSRTYGSPTGDEQALDDRALTRTMDGGSALCGSTTSYGSGLPNPNMLVLKLDPGGLPMWASSHPSPYWPGMGTDVALPMIERTAGGHAVAGYSNSFGLLGGGEDMTLSTFDPMGNRPVCSQPEQVEIMPLPWLEWKMGDTLVMPEMDSMPLVQEMVLHDSMCYDTTHVGLGGVGTPSPRLRLAARFGAVELELERSGLVAMSVCTVDGRVLADYAPAEYGAGRHVFELPDGLPRGVCIVRMATGGTVASIKVVRF